MIRRLYFLAVILTVIGALCALLLYIRPSSGDRESLYFISGDPISDPDRALLQNGDFILRRGNGLLSSLIVQSLGGPHGFSHAGVLFIDADGSIQVIHSIPRGLSDRDGVQRESLDAFTSKSISCSTSVVRLRSSLEEREKMASRARELLTQQIPFDREFQLGGQALYCSELLWMILPEDVRDKSMRYQEPSRVIRFESFLDPSYYDIILDCRKSLLSPR